jgi:hypothetical protein
VAAHLSTHHKKWAAIFRNCYLYGPVQKITILVSAHLRGRYKKAHRSLISVVLRPPLLIIYYWYRLVSPPILVSATVTSRYQYWIQGVTIDHFSSSVCASVELGRPHCRHEPTCRSAKRRVGGWLRGLLWHGFYLMKVSSFSIYPCSSTITVGNGAHLLVTDCGHSSLNTPSSTLVNITKISYRDTCYRYFLNLPL